MMSTHEVLEADPLRAGGNSTRPLACLAGRLLGRLSALALASSLLACSSGGTPQLPVTGDQPAKPPTTPVGKPSSSGAASGSNTPRSDPPGSDDDAAPELVSDALVGAAKRPRLQWKRYAAFEADLARAFELAPEELCSEFGAESCVRSVHLVPLGGHEPFVTGMLEPAAETLATTPTVVERIVLSVCNKRVELDRAAGAKDAKVFGQLDLDGQAPAADAPSVRALTTALYRRVLVRDPEPGELSIVSQLVVDDAGAQVSAADFAKLACFVVGTSSEFLFF
jgi:hypothetical protein